MRFFTLVVAGLCLAAPVPIAADSAGPPDWYREHLAYMTAGNGTWLADNAAFKSEEEPADAYEVTYVWGAGRQTASGTLRAVTGGKRSGVIWDYRVFWDPGEKKAVIQQWGAGGAYGVGETKRVDPKTWRSEQTFHGPDGSSRRDAHDWIVDGPLQHTTHSFSFQDGQWRPGWSYVWKRTLEANPED